MPYRCETGLNAVYFLARLRNLLRSLAKWVMSLVSLLNFLFSLFAPKATPFADGVNFVCWLALKILARSHCESNNEDRCRKGSNSDDFGVSEVRLSIHDRDGTVVSIVVLLTTYYGIDLTPRIDDGQ